MRELLLKALTSPENKKRDFYVQETFIKDGVQAKTLRRYFYFILGKTHIDDTNDIENLSHLALPQKKRHYYILKSRDTQTREDKLIIKVAGAFYAVCGNDIYRIAFVHMFKTTITAVTITGEKNQDVEA